LSFTIFFDLEEIIFENFNISENNIMSVEFAKVVGYVADILGKCWVGLMETMKKIGGPFKKSNAQGSRVCDRYLRKMRGGFHGKNENNRWAFQKIKCTAFWRRKIWPDNVSCRYKIFWQYFMKLRTARRNMETWRVLHPQRNSMA